MTFEDLRGQRINGLFVDDIEGRQPLRWRCHCTVCQTRQVHLHHRLRSGVAKCSNVNCAPKSAITENDQRELERARAEQAQNHAITEEIKAAKKREAARTKVEAERLELLHGGYMRYWNFMTRQPDHRLQPMTLDEWRHLTILGREKVLSFIDNGVPVTLTKELNSGQGTDRVFT